MPADVVVVGLQDALNLGWKLGMVPRSTDPDRLLDSYTEERHPVAELSASLADVVFRAESSPTTLAGLLRRLGRADPRRSTGATPQWRPVAGRLSPTCVARTSVPGTRRRIRGAARSTSSGPSTLIVRGRHDDAQAMMPWSRRRRALLGGIVGVVIVAMVVAACGAPVPPAGAGTAMGESSGGPMMGGARVDEAGYLAEMIPHHQEAVAAATQLVRSPRPEMRALGQRIVDTQSAEVQRMTGWLATWYPQEPRPAYRPMMSDLSPLSGDDLDRTFLTEMMPHHMSAVMMSQHLLVSGAPLHPEIAAFAGTVRDTQRDEIVLMRSWLTSWFPTTGPDAASPRRPVPGGMAPGGG